MNPRAFTLIETVVVTGLTALVLITLSFLILYFYRTNTYTLEQTVALEQARRGVQDAMQHLRAASYGSDGSYPILSATASSVTFFANVNADPVIERITYLLSGGTFRRVIEIPTGSPLSYASPITSTYAIATTVINTASTPVFRYFDRTGAELFMPVNLSRVASVQTTLIVDVSAHRAPIAFTLSGSANLRNLRGQP